MTYLKLLSQILAPILALMIFVAPLTAQRRAAPPPPKKPVPAPPSEPAVTFDSLLTDDSYRVYSEIRNVGQLVRSNGLNDLLDPIIKIAEPPKEFRMVLKWVDAHAEALATSRMLVGIWPGRPGLPTYLIAVEFSTADEAKKFEVDLKRFLPKLTPTPSPTPTASPMPGASPVVIAPVAPDPPAPAEMQYATRQTGSLVLLTEKPFSLRDLKPPRSKLLFEDPNFALARNRFNSEPIFIYVDVKGIENEQLEQKKRWEQESKDAEALIAKEAQLEKQNATLTPKVEASPEVLPEPELSATPPPTDISSSDPSAEADPNATLGAQNSARSEMIMMSMWSVIFGGQPKWPEGIGIAVTFEEDGYVLRALVVNGSDTKSNAIPFITQLASGPGIIPAGPNVIPADIDLFVSLSLDYLQIYDRMLKASADAQEMQRKRLDQPAATGPPESPFAVYEKKTGLTIKNDILPLLGHELAFAFLSKPTPESKPSPSPGASPSPDDGAGVVKAPDLMPVFAVSIKDRDAVRRIIPKIIDGMGLKGASLLAQTERREDTEVVSYANVFSYAFIGDFLLVTPDATATRRVVDAYLSHKTLSSDSNFRSATRWQPREIQGQVYAGASVIDLYNPLPNSGAINEKLSALLGELNPVINPLTYALSNDGMGALHELHLPRNLLLLFVAGLTASPNVSPIFANESMAQVSLRTLHSAETTFQSDMGKGQYGTLDELDKNGLLAKDLFEKYGYRFTVNVMANKFEATAIPTEYDKTGKMSFFIDETGVLRGGDHAGGPATVADKPIE